MGDEGTPEKRMRIDKVLEAVSCQRARGVAVADEAVVAEHPELVPELGEALAELRRAESAVRRGKAIPLSAEDATHQQSACDPLTRASDDDPADWESRSTAIPGYEITCEIYRGGQGVVYQAIQKSTKRKVAIKVLRQGTFASPDERFRFQREVHILAQLNHPNIVTIHDSGETAGGAYFVMDYITGKPLDQHVRDAKLSIEDILILFRKICEAVNVAHLRGFIHRDLKPSNILVHPSGEPQILDFGLAKVSDYEILDDDPSFHATITGQFLGSLHWASPEQAAGRPDKIDIRTDVYSLGVTLYEMLTGKFPYEVAGGMHDVLDRIVRAEPVRPSTIRSEINHEVETIVLKCLQKERERRYQSAGEIARDILRYENGEPIDAKRDSGWYVLRKSLRRYRVPVVLITTLVLAITVALVVALVARDRVAAQRDRALDAEERKHLVSAFLADVFRSANPFSTMHDGSTESLGRPRSQYAGQSGELATVLDVLRAAVIRLDASNLDPIVEAEIRHVLGATLADNGAFAEAIKQLRKAADLRAAHTGSDSVETLDSTERLAYATFYSGDKQRTLALARPLLKSLRQKRGPADAIAGRFATHVARSLEALKRWDEAIELLRDLSTAAAAAAGEDDESTVSLRLELARILSNHDGAAEALAINQECRHLLADRPALKHLYASAVVGVADALHDAGRYREAAEASRNAVKAYGAIHGDDHPLTAYQMVYLARALGQAGELEEARRVGEQAVEIHRRFGGKEHEWTYRAERALARILARLGENVERAETTARHALAGYERVYGVDHVDTLYARDVLGIVFHRSGRLAEAEQVFRENVAHGAHSVQGWEYARFLRSLGRCLAERGKRGEAEQQFLEAWDRMESVIGTESDSSRQIAEDFVELYEVWHAVEPDRGYDAKAAEWRAKLADWRATTQPATQPAG